MNNNDFLNIIKESFKRFLVTGSRSNEKLKILHGAIANDIQTRLREDEQDTYIIHSLGIGNGKEEDIAGRYLNKKVDITVTKNGIAVAGIAVKFVMQNYSQNSNNYFENMLGETANIRCNKVPYFQIFIIPETLPYYDNNGTLKKWERFTELNIHKYIELSNDSIETYLHTPTKVLLFVLDIPKPNKVILNKNDYVKAYGNCNDLQINAFQGYQHKFNNTLSTVIYNDYNMFANKLVHYIKAI